MANAPVFDWICGELERLSSLDTLEARGTVRLSLKKAGLEARSVSPGQLAVVVGRVLGEELRDRGIENPDQVCEELVTSLKSQTPASSDEESPEEVFRRLGGS